MKYAISALLLIFALTLCASAQKPKPTPKPKPIPRDTPKPAGPIKPDTAKAACPGANGLTAEEIAGILEDHNRIRAGLGLGALKWNCTLAASAQEWAAKGKFIHRENRTYGENMFVSTNAAIATSMAAFNWEKEKEFWNNTAGTCQAGKFCNHYTQIVWRATTQIGCGINRNASGQWKTLMVCNYDPAGNSKGKAY